MREDQEPLRVEPATTTLGDGVGFEHPVDSRDAAVADARGHGGAHRLRREHRHLQALVAVGDREPLRERDRRVLRHRVRRGAELGEQPGRRRGLEQVAAAALDHAGHEDARRVDVRHAR